MSTIDRLQIMGIRAFDNQRAELIQFETPLTLIVGSNGSGKTTIIECLKYVTTGQQPPNTKGGAFIHDPKLSGEKEVMAQVKLQFNSATGATMVASRSLQLSVNKLNKRTQKTLEGHLLIKKNGERTSISSRVAELDQVLPQYLGVSTAVLENVIFCHQDDALWPMSESGVLKKKFDDIFEAVKYTRAIKNIKDIRKAQNTDLAQKKIVEQHAKSDKERARRGKDKMDHLHKDIEEMRDEVHELDKNLNESKERAQQAWRDSESYSRIVGALEGKQIEVESKKKSITELRLHLREVPEPDVWLESTLAQFEQRLNQYEEQRRAKREEYDTNAAQLASGRIQLNQRLADRGKDEQEKAAYDRDVNSRKRKVQEVAAHQQWRGFDDFTDDTLVDEFMYKIRRVSKEQSLALERTRREAEIEKRNAQSLINRLTERKAALGQSKAEARQKIIDNEHEAKQYQRNVDKIAVDEGSSAIVQSKIESIEGRLRKSQEEATRAKWDNSIAESNVELRSYEEQSTRLNSDLIQGTKKAGETARLAHLKQELKDRQRSLKTMSDAHGSRISQLIGNAWQPSTIESNYHNVIDEAVKEISLSEKARDIVARELEQVQYKQKTIKDDLFKESREAEQAEKAVRDAIDDQEPSEYREAFDEAQLNLNELKDQSANMSAMAGYFKEMLQTSHDPEKPSCRACLRLFNGEQDPHLAKFRARMEVLIRKAMNESASQAEIDEAENVYQRILDAGPAHQRWEHLTDIEIPSLKTSGDDLAQQREVVLAKLDEHDTTVEQKHMIKKDLEQIGRAVASIAKFDTDITAFESQIVDLSAKQSENGGAHTLEDIQEEISNLLERIDKTKKHISRLTAEKDQYRNEISSMELEMRDLKNELNKTIYELEKKASLVARVEEFRTLNQKQREIVSKIDEEVESLDPEIATANAKYDDVAERASTEEKELQEQTAQLSQNLNALELLNNQIKAYIDHDGPNQLSKTNRDIKRIEQDMKTLETEQINITVGINNITEQLRDSENTRRQYSDNLRYRLESRDLKRVQGEIAELETQNAHSHRDRYLEESNRLSREISVMEARKAGRIGESAAKDQQLQELLRDFETDFKGAPKRYRKAHIEVELKKGAVEDLGRYAGALDKAIMKYHSMKMEEINRILEELWRNTYRGTDIDTILIKSENESTTGTHTHNYRVCMVKQDVEMDMRGRCSAGQKVLACILIRIALAEVFSTNCGLIALDEPTTNLDVDTIASLATSLHDIIKARKQQANFQLVIITHDEEFLKQMHVEDFSDYYYRVSRNARECSEIERQSISEVI